MIKAILVLVGMGIVGWIYGTKRRKKKEPYDPIGKW